MNRKDFIKTLALIPFGASTACRELGKMTENWSNTERMPVLFVGHGSPMNAIEENEFSRTWRELGARLPKPTAILCISAHWETKGTFVTAMNKPPTIYDFGGFPDELSAVRYTAPGSPWLVQEAKSSITTTTVGEDYDWGLDHGCWSILNNFYPAADIPVIQLSLDYTKDAYYHYNLAKQLSALRNKGVLIMGSGNMVHNLGMIQLRPGGDFNSHFGFDWAVEMNELFKQKIEAHDHQALVKYESLHKAAKLAIPTTDHYFPLLYVLALQDKSDKLSFFNDHPVAGSLTMTSVLLEG